MHSIWIFTGLIRPICVTQGKTERIFLCGAEGLRGSAARQKSTEPLPLLPKKYLLKKCKLRKALLYVIIYVDISEFLFDLKEISFYTDLLILIIKTNIVGQPPGAPREHSQSTIFSTGTSSACFLEKRVFFHLIFYKRSCRAQGNNRFVDPL